jgi:uncharacterized membrane protein
MSQADETSSGFYDRALEFVRTDNGQRMTIIAFSLVATIALITFPNTIAAYAFGIPLMFFVPGFTVVRMFFWKGTTPEAKFVLSLGLSILVVILLGLVLVLTPLGLTSDSTRASLVIFTLAAVAIEAFVLNGGEKGQPSPPATRKVEGSKPDMVVAAMLATALVVSAISLGLIITADYPSRTYFAITDPEGKMVGNASLVYGTNATYLLHMMNGESGPRNFTLVVYGKDTPAFGTQTLTKTMKEGETWNKSVSIQLTDSGYFRLDFDLYIQKSDQPPYLYGNLHLWVFIQPA